MSDSLTGFDQMRAIIESLRREVREQRKEIARLQAEINRLRLTDAEREAIMGVARVAAATDCRRPG